MSMTKIANVAGWTILLAPFVTLGVMAVWYGGWDAFESGFMLALALLAFFGIWLVAR